MIKDIYVPSQQSEAAHFDVMVPVSDAAWTRHNTATKHMPVRKPIDWQEDAAKVIGRTRDDLTALELMRLMHLSYVGWLPFVQEKASLTDNQTATLQQGNEAALFIGGATEENVFNYEVDIATIMLGAQAKYREQLLKNLRQWGGEESGHQATFQIIGAATNVLATVAFLETKTSQHNIGSGERPKSVLETKIYTSIQEQMAHIAHTRNGLLNEPFIDAELDHISSDEVAHWRIFSDEAVAIIAEFQDDGMMILYDVVMNFDMPGVAGIKNYQRKSLPISRANILTAEHFVQSVRMNMKHWGMLDETYADSLKTDGAKRRYEELINYIDGDQQKNDTDKLLAKAKGGFVLGVTLGRQALDGLRKAYIEEKFPDFLDRLKVA